MNYEAWILEIYEENIRRVNPFYSQESIMSAVEKVDAIIVETVHNLNSEWSTMLHEVLDSSGFYILEETEDVFLAKKDFNCYYFLLSPDCMNGIYEDALSRGLEMYTVVLQVDTFLEKILKEKIYKLLLSDYDELLYNKQANLCLKSILQLNRLD